MTGKDDENSKHWKYLNSVDGRKVIIALATVWVDRKQEELSRMLEEM